MTKQEFQEKILCIKTDNVGLKLLEGIKIRNQYIDSLEAHNQQLTKDNLELMKQVEECKMLVVKVIVEFIKPQATIALQKIVNLKCMPSIGTTLLIDDDINIDIGDDADTKTRITVASQVPNGVDAIIRNITYYNNLSNDEFVIHAQHYIDSGWELITDSCKLMVKNGDTNERKD